MTEELHSIVEDKQEIALNRAIELKEKIRDYLEARRNIPCGLEMPEVLQERKSLILKALGGREEDWHNWKWQVSHRITEVETLTKILNLTPEEIADIANTGAKYRWAVSPYYLSLMNPDDAGCPVRKQALPSALELIEDGGKDDPMAEEFTSPAPCITRRYPDRLIINVTNQCAMYCRHCQRRRNIGEVDKKRTKEELAAALAYIRANDEIRDVLITGGDALMLDDSTLDWLLTELDHIPHVEIKRLGSRTLVTVPQRITQELLDIISKHPPIYINTHFNHSMEVTEEVRQACLKLVKAGAVLGNQAVLLNGVNNDPHVMKKLNHALLKVMIRPYYIFHPKAVTGTSHFWTRVEEGMEIMEHLRGYTSGLAIPYYIINAPKGYGKTPVLPDYIISQAKKTITIRTWENRVMEFPNIRADENTFKIHK